MNTSVSRDIVTSRFLFNVLKRNSYRDTLKDAIVGDFKFSAQTMDDHYGWLKCDGRALNKNEYIRLWNVIGYIHGGSGNTFYLPDCRGRVPAAVGAPVNQQMGVKRGEETHTLTIAQMPTHNHEITDNGHTHSIGDIPNGTQTISALGGGSTTAADETRYIGTTSESFTNITINNTGGGDPHNNMQPTIFLGNMYIYSGVLDPNEPQVDITGRDDTEYPPEN
jgi:microcystin-dependent protein